MRIFRCFNLVLLICLAGPLFSIDVEGIGDVGDIAGQVLEEVGGVNTNPQKLIKGFADALVFAGYGATQRAYGDYESIAITIGAMAGLRSKERVYSADTFAAAADTLFKDGDYTLGINVQTPIIQFGMNVSGWRIGFRIGGTHIALADELNFSAFHLGLVGHYQLIAGRPMGNGYEKMFRWRGLSLGSGILYQRAEFSYAYTFDDFESTVHEPLVSFNHTYIARDPKLTLDMTTTVVTVPLELNTAGLLFYILNVNVGVGADISFGINDASVSMNTDVYDRDNNDPGKEPEHSGTIQAEGGGTARPTIVNPKLLFNLGIKAGPFIVDIPLAWYLIGGFHAGLTVGFSL